MATKSVSIRIEEEMLSKLSFVADYEGRSINSHVLVLIRQSIQDFEKQHGKIDGKISPDSNVKPPKKDWLLKTLAKIQVLASSIIDFMIDNVNLFLFGHSGNRPDYSFYPQASKICNFLPRERNQFFGVTFFVGI